MKFTFGIISSNLGPPHIQYVVDSIDIEIIKNTSNFEIIIVGGDKLYNDETMKIIPFDETKKNGWITRKKNIITENAKYDNIVYMHDYVTLVPGWFDAMNKFGEDFDICMTKILNADGTRFRDWSLWPHDLDNVWGPHCRECLLPYNITSLSKLMYISGTYWIAKKHVMQEFPLNEDLSWGQSEDVEWSKRVRQKYNFSINPNASVKFLKQKDRVFSEITPETLKTVENYNATL